MKVKQRNLFKYFSTLLLFLNLSACRLNSTSAPAAIVVTDPSVITPTSGVAIGATSFTITGVNLSDTTGITFDGVAATSVNVVSDTTVTGVTPAHAVGSVDIVITRTSGSETLLNGYSYITTAVGLNSGGGVIGCLNGGLNDFILNPTAPSSGLDWGGSGTITGASNAANGYTNTATIVGAVGPGTYAAKSCYDYEVDSQGNTPCQPGNTCYSDWFLPALSQLNCSYTNRAEAGTWAPSRYWSSNESGGVPATLAESVDFNLGAGFAEAKTTVNAYQCIRSI
jgi:hypothetical protein